MSNSFGELWQEVGAKMQEEVVQWDPMYEHHLGGATKLFLLYLLIVVAISLAKSIGLARQLLRLRRILPKETLNEHGKAELLAASAIGMRFSTDRSNLGSDVSASEYSRILLQANNKFLYTWELCAAKAASIRKLTLLTLLLSVLILTFSAITILMEIMHLKSRSIGVFTGTVADELVPFALGILICAVLYALFSLFEGILMRRRARWNYFCAKAKSDSVVE